MDTNQQKPPEKKENPTHPITGKKLDTRVKEPGKNVERQLQAVGNIGTKSDAQVMRDAGYSESYANNPKQFKSSKSFTQMLDEILPDEDTLNKHAELLNSRRLDHMTFPTKVEDEVIAELLASVNCVLRKIVHGEQAKHAYFWAMDNRARKDALDMLYKLKGKYAPEKFEDVSKFSNLSTEELLKRKKAALDFFKKRPPTSTPKPPTAS